MRSDFATMLAIARDGPDALESPGRSLTLPCPGRERPRPDLRAFSDVRGSLHQRGYDGVRLADAAAVMDYSRAPCGDRPPEGGRVRRPRRVRPPDSHLVG